MPNPNNGPNPECPHCGGTGKISVSVSGNSPDTNEYPCPECCDAVEEDLRERDDDDGSSYGDPRDEMDERMRRD